MSHAKARQVINRAKALLNGHYSADPQCELPAEKVLALQKDIDLAEMHLGDEPAEFYHGDHQQQYSEHEE